MARQLKDGEITLKDMSVTMEADSARNQSESSMGHLRDHTQKHNVTMYWNLSEEAKENRIFKLKVDNIEVILDAEQFSRYLRWC